MKRPTAATLPLALLLLVACAKMGEPDGGWYDETPPVIVRTTPADRSTGVTSSKVSIVFDEYIAIEDVSEKVVISPPQIETPDISAGGKIIKIELHDTLRPATTYTIDFSDAISDNNEGNPLGNYTYTFSTGDEIDTLEVAGTVVEAENLEPVKGILVGLYSDLEDSAFHTKPMLRVSRTGSDGRFIIRGVAPGSYRIYALNDMDGNYMFSQKSEQLAFTDEVITPSWKADTRQDTLWRDSLHINSIQRVPYTHFLPDDIVLRAYTVEQTDRYFLKSDRTEADHFTLFFSYGSDTLPSVRLLGHEESPVVIEPSLHNDTISYWLADTALVNEDTLMVELTYMMTDTTGLLTPQTDTLEILAKTPYDKRLKAKEKAYDDWKKKQEKAERRGLPFDTVMKVEPLKIEWRSTAELAPDRNITVTTPYPLAVADTSKIHLYSKIDTLWYRAPFVFRPTATRSYELLGEWRPGVEYSLEVDSAAFISIYGLASEPYKNGFKVKSLDAFSTVLVNITGMEGLPLVVQLMDGSDKVVKTVSTTNGTAEFFYVNPATLFMRLFVDSNGNGKWDTGTALTTEPTDTAEAYFTQPETVYYYPKKIECKAKWDLTLTWDPGDTKAALKPSEITKQKGDTKKKQKNLNAERAKKLGIEYVP